MAKRPSVPSPVVAPPGWRDLPDDSGSDYLVSGVAVVTVRAAVSADPRRDTWEWSTASRNGRHVGDIDSAKARALDQHQRHG